MQRKSHHTTPPRYVKPGRTLTIIRNGITTEFWHHPTKGYRRRRVW